MSFLFYSRTSASSLSKRCPRNLSRLFFSSEKSAKADGPIHWSHQNWDELPEGYDEVADEGAWYKSNPNLLMQGLTPEKIEQDKNLRDFLAANYLEKDQPVTIKEEVVVETSGLSEEEEKVQALRKSLNIRSLSTYSRDTEAEGGSRRAVELRDQRLIPGMIYGGDPFQGIDGWDYEHRIGVKTPWPNIQREIDLGSMWHLESKVYDLEVRDIESEEVIGVHRVIPRDVNWHPVLNEPYCVNYLRYHPRRPIQIPIRYINEEESAALKRGCFIVPVNKFIEVVVEEGAPIPEFIDLDCAGIEYKDVLRLERLIFPDGVRVSKNVKKSYLVGPVQGKSAGAAASNVPEKDS